MDLGARLSGKQRIADELNQRILDVHVISMRRDWADAMSLRLAVRSYDPSATSQIS
jgi:hypothetical protein